MKRLITASLLLLLSVPAWAGGSSGQDLQDPDEDLLLDEEDELELAPLDAGEDPQAAEDPFLLDDELEPLHAGQAPGRAARAHKKKSAKDDTPSPDDFSLDEDEPVEDFDLGGEPVEDFDLGEPSDEDDLMADPEEDFDLEPLDDGSSVGDLGESTAKESAPAGRRPGPIDLDVVGKVPLENNYPGSIVAVDRDAVVVELPILLGRSRADFEGKDYWVVVDVLVDGKKVAETRQWVTADSMAEFGPTFMFAKLAVPVPDEKGELVLRVSRADGSSGEPKLLFERQVPYSLH